MKALFAVLLMLLLAGCAGAGGVGYQGMSADQIGALAKMKDANINCIKGNTVWTGAFITVFVNYDKGVIPDGEITVTGDCQISLTNTKVIKTVTTTTTPVPVK